MRFPITELDIDQYFKKIVETIESTECRIYIDTNILAKYYVFHSQARKELNEFLTQYVSLNKLFVPVWVLNEYSKHFMRQKTKNYLRGGELIKQIESNFSEFKKFLTMYVDESDLEKYDYLDHDQLTDDLKDIQLKLEKFAKMKVIRNDHDIKMHNEIIELFDGCVLNTDIYSLSDRVSKVSSHRYSNDLPPGFEDSGKENNSCGDLILWHEILEDCKNNETKKVIIITDDNKRDWVYAPYKVIIKGKTKPNPQPNYKIIDPRLVYEFKLSTGSEDVYIVTLDLLTIALLKSGNKDLYQVARALQIEHETEIKTNSLEQTSPEVDVKNGLITEVVSGNVLKNIYDDNYSKQVFCDSTYNKFENSNIQFIIENLKSYNWYNQNPMIKEVNAIEDDDLIKNRKTADELFILGRNIYQAASGGAWLVHQFVEELALRSDLINPFISYCNPS